MRGTAPVGSRDHPALPHQLALQRHVVKIAAHRQPPIAAPADITMDQHLRAAVGPCRPTRRGDLRELGARQRIGAGRFEQAIVAQVRGDHARQLDPERGSARLVGRRRDVSIGGKGRDCDAEILPGALVGDGEAEPTLRLLDRLDLAALRQRFAKVGLLRRCGSGNEEGECKTKIFHRARFLSKRAPSMVRHAL